MNAGSSKLMFLEYASSVYDCFVEHNETLQIRITAGTSDTVWWDYKCVYKVSTNFFVAVEK